MPRRLGRDPAAAGAGRRHGRLLRWRCAVARGAGRGPRRALRCSAGSRSSLLGFAGLPLIGRYLLLPAAMLAIFFGFAALGGCGSSRTPARGAGSIGGARAAGRLRRLALANISATPRRLRDGIQLRGKIEDDLRDLDARPMRAEPLLERCAPVYVPNHRPVPILAWYLDRPPEEIVSAQLERPAARALRRARAPAMVEEKFVLDPRDPRRFDPARPAGFRRVAENRSWVLYERVRCSVVREMDRAPTSETGSQACQPRLGSGQASPRHMEKTA